MNSGPLSGEELAAWRGMLEVNSRLTHRLDAEMQAAHGLSLSAYEVLMFLDVGGSASQEAVTNAPGGIGPLAQIP